MSKPRTIFENDFCNQFIDYFKQVSALSTPEVLLDIVNHPANYKMTPQSISYSIIKMHLDKEKEEKILAYIKSRDRDISFEFDLKYRNGPLHWCAILNYSTELCFHTHGLEATNLLGLTPVQLALILGNDKFANKYSPSNSKFNINNIFSLNSLFLSILLNDQKWVLFFSQELGFFGALNTGDGVGNILHAIVYSALIEINYQNYKIPTQAINIFNIVKPFLRVGLRSQPHLPALLSEKSKNFENCTPVELAKKYGLDFMALFVNSNASKVQNSNADELPLRLTLLTAAASIEAKQSQPIESKSVLSTASMFKDSKSNSTKKTRIMELLDELNAILGTNPDLSDALEKGFCDPVTLEFMTDPVLLADGHPYQRSSAEKFIGTKSHDQPLFSPITNVKLEHRMMTIAIQIQEKIIAYIQEKIKTVKEKQKAEQPHPPGGASIVTASPK